MTTPQAPFTPEIKNDEPDKLVQEEMDRISEQDKVKNNEQELMGTEVNLQTEVKGEDEGTELINPNTKKDSEAVNDENETLERDLTLKSTIGRTGLPNVQIMEATLKAGEPSAATTEMTTAVAAEEKKPNPLIAKKMLAASNAAKNSVSPFSVGAKK